MLYGFFRQMDGSTTSTGNMAKHSGTSPLILPNWFYNREFDPFFTIGLTLRQIDIAQNVEEEQNLAREWLLFARIKDSATGTKVEDQTDGDVEMATE